jgi:hypothetical protein
MYQQSESYKVTREKYIREFLNAETAYDRYAVFMNLLNWLDSKDELGYLREQEIKRLQDSVKGYDLNEYIGEAHDVA